MISENLNARGRGSRAQTSRRLSAALIVLALWIAVRAGESLQAAGEPRPTANSGNIGSSPGISQVGATAADNPAAGTPVEHPLTKPLEIARESMRALADVNDYEGRFSKREIVNGQMITHVMQIKHRVNPFSVYLRFADPHQGREVIYVEGKNDGKLLAHDAGIKAIAGTFALLPTSAMAMSESKHPISSIGMKKLLQGVIDQWEAETKYGEVNVQYYNNAKLQDVACTVVETSHPQPRRQFTCHLTRLYLDKKTNLPVRVERFGFPVREGAKPPLLEEYTYSQVRTNVGLQDSDFDPRNKTYSF